MFCSHQLFEGTVRLSATQGSKKPKHVFLALVLCWFPALHSNTAVSEPPRPYTFLKSLRVFVVFYLILLPYSTGIREI